MARIPLPTPETMTPEQRAVYEAIGKLRNGHVPLPYRAGLHNPEMTDKWQQLGELLRYRTSLPPRLSQLAIVVLAQHYKCRYMWGAHEPITLKAGISQSIIDAIKADKRPTFDKADEQAVYGYSAELLETRSISAPRHAEILAAIGVTGAVELTALLGYYAMVAMMLNAHDLP